MAAVLLDTHAWVWSFAAPTLLSPAARAAIETAEVVYVSPVSFFEIAQKVRLGKWPEMARRADRLPAILHEQGRGRGALHPGDLPRGRSPRLAAPRSAQPADRCHRRRPAARLVSRDPVFDGLGVSRCW